MDIGIDVGGTNLKAGLVDDGGTILAVHREPLQFEGPEKFAETLANLVRKTASLGGVSEEEIQSVGVGLPGALDGGEILYITNIPMEHVPLTALFHNCLDLPLYLGNDGDCAAVGEYFYGAGRGTRDFAVVTLGTGIGGGLIINGRLHTGMGSGGEVGHIATHPGGELCNCGRRGCWERYGSATALIRRTREAMEAHPESLLYAVAEESGAVDGRTAFDAALRGDEAALEVCGRYVQELAYGVTDLVNVLQPECLALGGGVAAAPDALLLAPLRKLVDRDCFANRGGRLTRLVRAELGNDAGIIGAAMLRRAI